MSSTATDETPDELAKMREHEAEMERKFPGYPSYLSEITLQKIEWMVEHRVDEITDIMRELFGIAGVNSVGHERMKKWMHEILASLAQSVSHQAAGYMAVEAAHNAEKASHNLFQGVIAGIALASKDNTESEEGTS